MQSTKRGTLQRDTTEEHDAGSLFAKARSPRLRMRLSPGHERARLGSPRVTGRVGIAGDQKSVQLTAPRRAPPRTTTARPLTCDLRHPAQPGHLFRGVEPSPDQPPTTPRCLRYPGADRSNVPLPLHAREPALAAQPAIRAGIGSQLQGATCIRSLRHSLFGQYAAADKLAAGCWPMHRTERTEVERPTILWPFWVVGAHGGSGASRREGLCVGQFSASQQRET